MSIDAATLAAIAAMALVTFACRAAGFLVLRSVQPGPFLRGFLAFLPGTLFVAFAAPALARGGWPGLAGGAATLIVMRATGSTLGALAGGVASFWAVRAMMGG